MSFSADDFAESGDEALMVTFFTKPMASRVKSEAAGREVFVDLEYVRIMVKGDTKSIMERKARDEDKRRFPSQYKAYSEGKEMALEGLPLEAWAYLSPARVMTLKGSGFRTVEDLATAQEHQLEGIGMGARDLVEMAKQAVAEPGDVEKKLRAENKKLKTELRNVKAQLDAATQAQAA